MALDLADRHPSDPGVVAALLLNLVRLAPGEALFLGAGTLHCYLGGSGVELMANSDNVLRGGLTNKPIDVTAMLEIVDVTPTDPAVQSPEPVGGIAVYRCPVPEFSLSRLEIAGDDRIATEGPAVLFCVDGVVETDTQTLDRGRGGVDRRLGTARDPEGSGHRVQGRGGRLRSTLTGAEG